jgi:hypothetical protein
MMFDGCDSAAPGFIDKQLKVPSVSALSERSAMVRNASVPMNFFSSRDNWQSGSAQLQPGGGGGQVFP